MEEKVEYNAQQFSATDTLKKRIIDYIFRLCEMATNKQEEVSSYTYETGFVRGVRMAKSLLWKYVPTEIRAPIKELYETLDKELKRIDVNDVMNEDMKKLNMKQVADAVSIQVLEFLLVVLLYSPMSTEFKEMEVFGDFQELIKTIRSKEPVKLFSGEMTDEN
jgi:hypothetical protein